MTMFSILPADEQKTAQLLQREGLTQPAMAMVLTMGGEERGYVLLSLQRDIAEILCLRSQNEELEEWLVRAALNAAANRNAITAVCKDPIVFPLLTRLGFAANGEGDAVFIPEFVMRPCRGD